MTAWVQESPLGPITLSVTPTGLRALDFGGHASVPVGAPADTAAARTAAAVDAWFGGDLDALDDLPVDLSGRSPFSVAVLTALRSVLAGHTTTYGKLAALAGKPTASRAIGQAVGANPLPIVVPCHRVIASDGTLGGFSAGLERKRWLLRHERVLTPPGGWTSRRAPVETSPTLGL